MGFKCGIVGLPNVGKSTLFNALTKTAAAQAANYPFCTIEPNTGEVAVPDPRMQEIAKIAGSKEIIPTRINFVDIAGISLHFYWSIRISNCRRYSCRSRFDSRFPGLERRRKGTLK